MPSWLGQPSLQPKAEEPFTLPVQEVPRDLWLPKPPAQVAKKRPRRPVRTTVVLPSVILFALLSAFFSWVTAEPLWLAVGHGNTVTATVTKCVGAGLARRCLGEVDDQRVTLHGVSAGTGARVQVQRVGSRSHQAYAGGLFLRWFAGLAMVLACGAGIALVTRSRERSTWGTSLAAPLLVTIGFLAATF
jgi:hypothetical protein